MIADPHRLYEGHPGECIAMEKVWEELRAATRTRAPVLIRGESGTGKELIARTLGRATGAGPWVVVNCCAISESLIESELFGHAKGSFSGADRDREGLFETANGGGIFLDEIGDIPPSTQARLLRVLQEGEIRRVGESRVRKVDVRVIAATNRNLEEAMAQGSFREDLFYRLNVHQVLLPALRQRREDVPGLVKFLIKKHTRAGYPLRPVTPDAMSTLQAYPWPGNVRELESVIVRVLAFGGHMALKSDDLRAHLKPLPSGLEITQPFLDMTYVGLRMAQDDLERQYIQEHLRAHRGSVVKAAAAMGIGRTALHNRFKALGIDAKKLRVEIRSD